MIFYIVFTLMGQFCDAEVRSSRGRADAVVKTGNYIYIFEFKLGGSADAALEQIDSRGYLIPTPPMAAPWSGQVSLSMPPHAISGNGK